VGYSDYVTFFIHYDYFAFVSDLEEKVGGQKDSLPPPPEEKSGGAGAPPAPRSRRPCKKHERGEYLRQHKQGEYPIKFEEGHIPESFLCERGTIKNEVKEAMGRPIVMVKMLGLQCRDVPLGRTFFSYCFDDQWHR